MDTKRELGLKCQDNGSLTRDYVMNIKKYI